MLEQARAKAERAQVVACLREGDAAHPDVDGPFDVLICRHVERQLGPTTVTRLVDEQLWGGPISDERYLVSAIRVN